MLNLFYIPDFSGFRRYIAELNIRLNNSVRGEIIASLRVIQGKPLNAFVVRIIKPSSRYRKNPEVSHLLVQQ